MAGTEWKKAMGDSVWRLMVINLAVFVGVHLAVLCGADEASLVSMFCLPAAMKDYVTHVWTAVIYMFTQFDVMHFIFNMLWLWCFGTLMTRTGVTSKRLYAIYMAGGLAGAVVFLAFGALGSARGWLLGSSASVLAVISACGIMCDRLRVSMMFVGSVQTRWLALAVVAFVLIANSSAMGYPVLCAHLAGALAGAVYAWSTTRKSQSVRVRVPRVEPYRGGYSKKRTGESRGLDPTEQARLDELLAKVKNGGYSALSASEKENLFRLSQKIR